jgi:hypothetical protein
MMHGRLVALCLAAASIAAAGCKREGAPAGGGSGAAAGSGSGAGSGEPAPERVAKGQQAVGALKKQLVAALTEAIKSSGAPAAIAVCSGVAPGIAQSLSAGGVTVGRATRKPRNPANAAAGWRADALAHFEARVAAGQPLGGATWASRLPDGTTAYAEPLVIQELCLACHGARLAPEVAAALAERYPADQATGYAVGDLRGVAWAEIAGAQAQPSPPR